MDVMMKISRKNCAIELNSGGGGRGWRESRVEKKTKRHRYSYE